jgi:hypothetical protein
MLVGASNERQARMAHATSDIERAAAALGEVAFGFGCCCSGLTEKGRRSVREEGLSFFTKAERVQLISMVHVVLGAVGDRRARSESVVALKNSSKQ